MAAAEEMNEEKILALARTAKDAIIFQRRGKEIFLVLECVLFQNSLPKRWMQGFVSLESVTGIKSAYPQNECTSPEKASASEKHFVKINKLFFAVALMLTHIRKLFEIHPKYSIMF